MLKSFFIVCGSFFFALFFLFVLQLNWRGSTLEVHFISWMRQSRITKTLQGESEKFQVKLNKKVLDLKKNWTELGGKKIKQLKKKSDRFLSNQGLSSAQNLDRSVDFTHPKKENRLNKISQSLEKKFKRNLSNTKK